jgi:hypothetical protein
VTSRSRRRSDTHLDQRGGRLNGRQARTCTSPWPRSPPAVSSWCRAAVPLLQGAASNVSFIGGIFTPRIVNINLDYSSIEQGVTATGIAHTARPCRRRPTARASQRVTDLRAGANFSVSAGLPFAPGSASFALSLTREPALAYRIAYGANSSLIPIYPPTVSRVARWPSPTRAST